MIYIWATCLPESAPTSLVFPICQKNQYETRKTLFGKLAVIPAQIGNLQNFARFQTFQLDTRVDFEKIVAKTALQQFRNIYLLVQDGSTFFKTRQDISTFFSISSSISPAPFPAPFQQVPSSLSTSLQRRFNIASTPLQHRFNSAPTALQQRFNSASTALQQRFNSASTALQQLLNTSSTPPQHLFNINTIFFNVVSISFQHRFTAIPH